MVPDSQLTEAPRLNSNPSHHCICIGITGGSGSGKTTVAQRILEAFPNDAAILPQDSYYKDLSHLPAENRAKLNFDHPDAFDMPLFLDAVRALRDGRDAAMPIYNYATHGRLAQTTCIKAPRILIIEGILVLYPPELRELCDVKVFVDADADLRFIRRMNRDVHERGRSFENVVTQYLKTVRDMHLEFIEPTKRYADFILPEGGYNKPAMRVLIAYMRDYLANHIPHTE
jgi:uridine kinase